VAGGKRRRLLAGTGAIRRRQFCGFKGAWVPMNSITAIKVSWFLAGSRVPETAETPCPPPRASAHHQPTPLPADG